jgi:hypothetical protein
MELLQGYLQDLEYQRAEIHNTISALHRARKDASDVQTEIYSLEEHLKRLVNSADWTLLLGYSLIFLDNLVGLAHT